jgi:pectin methylesterase-like acyl-CoA thioesterase
MRKIDSLSAARTIIICCICMFFCTAAFSQTLVPANNASGVSADMQFKLSFNAAPKLQRAGNISLYQSNGTLVETINMSLMPAGTPLSATWPWTETLNGNTIRVVPVTIDGNDVYIRFSIGAMQYNTSYYITVGQSVFSNSATIGFSGIGTNSWNFTTRAMPSADLDYIVSADGTGDFATLQGALDFLPAGKSNSRIFIKNGTYVGLVYMRNKSGFTIEGQSKTGVVITGYNCSDLNASTHWRSVVNLQGDDINIMNITFINTVPNGGGQAEALKLNGNRCIILNCEFYSYQDTVLIEGKVYFKDCMLEGDVDFIWGTGSVFFQSCELRANDNGGYNVMARNNNTRHGYAFADCKLTRTSAATKTQYLGRDAGTGFPYAEIVYLNCTMGSHIADAGWQIRNEMNGTGIVFAEYKSIDESGNLKNVSSRHTLSKQLSTAQATQYRDLDWFFNGWTPVLPVMQNSPSVNIASPANNTVHEAPASITITAIANDTDGTIAKVEFFSGATLIGSKTAMPYSIVWENVAAGSYTITAKATDNSGASTTSSAIAISVIGADCAGVMGGTARIDNCGVCAGGTTGKTACVAKKAQAEDMCQFDGTIDSNHQGFEGTGFVNITNALDAKITLDINSAKAQSIFLNIVYANGGTTDRAAKVLINGQQVLASFSMLPTGAWATFSAAGTNLPLVAGLNKVELISTTSDGLPNLDFFEIYGDAAFIPCPETQAIALAAGWNLVSINVEPTPNIVDGSDKAGLVSQIFANLDVMEIKTMDSFWRAGQPDYLNSLQSIAPGQGYLVKMNTAGTLTVTGTHCTGVLQYAPTGWQLIGCPYPTATPISGILGSNLWVIKNFDGFWMPNGTASSIENLEPGKGYFIINR